ncbi:hypothetical protein BCR33DRAFT_520170 [Rhizoclosmatium globosum]|uniref:EF-hand domain-containing protein n=1 Tax=Rhizoclosmatium globosum TaxID=329046 RepID=A0A1Y2BGJ4_9FUNG|nr:hypothetical protein BCR33DRAFT_520170 [Rhizoclosmatium globosum]|eukprot:ORY33607.1 hypothetical protein BCR33DRAFT_520170 [Rhizoclosmatium globosum]
MMSDLKSCFTSIQRPSITEDGLPQTRLPNALYRNEMWPVTTVLCVPRYCSTTLFDRVLEFKYGGVIPSVESRKDTASTRIHETSKKEENEDEEDEDEDEDEEDELEHSTTTMHFINNGGSNTSNTSTSNYLTPLDFQPVVDEVVQRHPGLEFLSSLAVFQARYAETVITRIFYSKLNNCNERMTLPEFRKHPFLHLLINLQLDDDINATRDVFSYKHFYVIYCKFWELDTDHNMIIEAPDMSRYDRGAITEVMMKRVVSGCGKPLSLGNKSGQVSYRDFVWFMLCVEDKRKTGSIEYWFRCLDVDGDGVLSFHELQEFYAHQVKRMVDYRMSEPWKFDDFICSLIDLIQPKTPSHITLRDLKRTPPQNAALFFDMLFDLRKYDNHVRRIDPMYREMDDVVVEEDGGRRKVRLEGWDKFAERAYELLAYEELDCGGGEDNVEDDELGEDEKEIVKKLVSYRSGSDRGSGGDVGGNLNRVRSYRNVSIEELGFVDGCLFFI